MSCRCEVESALVGTPESVSSDLGDPGADRPTGSAPGYIFGAGQPAVGDLGIISCRTQGDDDLGASFYFHEAVTDMKQALTLNAPQHPTSLTRSTGLQN